MSFTIGVVGTTPLAIALAARLGGGSSGPRVIVHAMTAADRATMPRKARIEISPNLFDLASECEEIVCACASHAELRLALTGTQDRPGLIGALAPDTALIDFTPGTPDECARLAGELSGGAIGYVEAACIGGPEVVREGATRIYAGGFGEHVLRFVSAFEKTGRLIRVGPQGHGRVMAALIDAQAAARAALDAELTAVAAAYGLDAEIAKDILAENLSPYEAITDHATTLGEARGVAVPLIAQAKAGKG